MSERGADVHERRRRFLLHALTSGLLAGGLGWNVRALAALFGKLPSKMPAGRSVFEVQGEVRADGRKVTPDTVLTAESRLESSAGAYLILVVGDAAFLLRENSTLQFSGQRSLVRGLQLVTGALLSVFGHRQDADAVQVRTPVASLGIRGTGFYTEAAADRTYFCTCYGRTLISSVAAPQESEEIVSRHHDAPRYILAAPEGGRHIVPAPFKDHTDLELMTLEALCGRKVPFVDSGDYGAPRRDY
ncbi:MAG: FecR domain-containing protein [Nevskia sp.]|nr:FecR domain-containing protein [Nevskia sp.]